jgi:hypothetical protein
VTIVSLILQWDMIGSLVISRINPYRPPLINYSCVCVRVWLPVVTAKPCYIYNTANFATPGIFDPCRGTVNLILLAERYPSMHHRILPSKHQLTPVCAVLIVTLC